MFMKTILSAAVAAMLAHAAQAQDFYGGVALDYNQPHSGEGHAAAALMVGARFGAGPLQYGAEVEYGTPVDGSNTYDASRLRAVGAYDFGGVTGIATLGATRFSDGGADFSGYNFGLGGEMPAFGNARLRFEFIRDIMDDYPTDVTTTRIGLNFSF